MLPHHPVHRFLIQVLLWLPVCFLAWYWLAGVWLWPVWWLVQGLFTATLPTLVGDVEMNGRLFELVTRLKTRSEMGAGVLSLDVRPLVYAYSLPLYAALTLSAPARTRLRKALYLVLGLLALLPFVVWGASFEILKHLAFTLGSETAPFVDFSGGRREFIGWGYQFGYLILPGVAPLVLWIALHRDFLQDLAPGFFRQTAPDADSPPNPGKANP